jgi:hypothetical protein
MPRGIASAKSSGLFMWGVMPDALTWSWDGGSRETAMVGWMLLANGGKLAGRPRASALSIIPSGSILETAEDAVDSISRHSRASTSKIARSVLAFAMR